MSTALLIARLVLGLGMAAHGTQKLFGWFSGYGLNATGEFFAQLGFRPGRMFATAAALGEVGSGLLVALGLLGPIGPAIMILVMTVAILTVHASHGFFAAKNGIELPLLFATGALMLALTGPGAYSLDALLGLTGLWNPHLAWVAVAAGVILGIVNSAVRRPTPAKA